MTQTGGLTILYAWLIFAGLLTVLACLLLRHEQRPATGPHPPRHRRRRDRTPPPQPGVAARSAVGPLAASVPGRRQEHQRPVHGGSQRNPAVHPGQPQRCAKPTGPGSHAHHSGSRAGGPAIHAIPPAGPARRSAA